MGEYEDDFDLGKGTLEEDILDQDLADADLSDSDSNADRDEEIWDDMA